MSTEDEWVVLRTFDSEGEARVVESFLKSRDIEVQLLDTHTHGFAPIKGLLKRQGLRLIVREKDLAHAEEALEEEVPTHLSVAEGHPPKVEMPFAEKILWFTFLVLAVIALALWNK